MKIADKEFQALWLLLIKKPTYSVNKRKSKPWGSPEIVNKSI